MLKVRRVVDDVALQRIQSRQIARRRVRCTRNFLTGTGTGTGTQIQGCSSPYKARNSLVEQALKSAKNTDIHKTPGNPKKCVHPRCDFVSKCASAPKRNLIKLAYKQFLLISQAAAAHSNTAQLRIKGQMASRPIETRCDCDVI